MFITFIKVKQNVYDNINALIFVDVENILRNIHKNQHLNFM